MLPAFLLVAGIVMLGGGSAGTVLGGVLIAGAVVSKIFGGRVADWITRRGKGAAEGC